MTLGAAEVYQLIDAASRLPYGRAKTVAIEEAVAQADASTDPGVASLRVFARLNLVSAYVYGGEHPRMFTPFSWVLTRFDTHPGEFDDDDRHTLLWTFKWATVGMTKYPEVPLQRIDAALDDMERRFRAAGEQLGPVLGCRYQVAAHVHGHAAAAAAFHAWIEAPRTRLSDCAACEPSTRAEFYAATDRDDDAVRELLPVLDGTNTCLEQPELAIGTLLLPMVRTGRLEQVRDEHLRGLRPVRRNPAQIGIIGQHIEFCALTGNEARGLDLVEEHLPLLEHASHPESRLDLAATSALLLSRLVADGHGNRALHLSGGEVPTVAALHHQLERRALDVAASFDARNGTDVVGERVRRRLTATPLALVDLGGVSRPLVPAPQPVGRPGGDAGLDSVRPPAQQVAGLAGLPPEALVERVEEGFRHGSVGDIEAVIDVHADTREQVVAAAPDASPPHQRAVARLDALYARFRLAGDPLACRRVTTAAADLARVAGEPAEAALYLMWLETVDATDGDEGSLGRADRLLAEVVASGTAAQIGRAHSRLVMVARALGDVVRARAALTAGLAALDGADDIDSRGTRGDLLLELADMEASVGDFEAAASSARQVLAALGPDEWLTVRANSSYLLGRVLHGQPAEAAAAFTAAVETARRAGLDQIAADSLARRGDAIAWSVDPSTGARAITEALPDVDRLLPVRAAASRRLDLVVALRRCDRHAEAAEVAETALRMVAAGEDDWLRGALAFQAANASRDLGDGAGAERLAVAAAASYRAAGAAREAVEAVEIAAFAAEQQDDFALAQELWRQMAEDADAAGSDAHAVAALRCRALCLAGVGDHAAASRSLAAAEGRLDAADLEPDAEEWERASIDLQRLRITALAGRPLDGVADGRRAVERFEALGDHGSADWARGPLAAALIEAGRVADALEILRDGAEAALRRGDSDGARMLGGRLARELDDCGRAADADAAWRRYSGED